MSDTGISERRIFARRRQRRTFDHGQPIARIDTLPILLLLICLVATFLRVQSPPPHALLVDLPTMSERDLRLPVKGKMLVLQIGVLDDGTPTFNGNRVTPEVLANLLATAAILPEPPGTVFEPSPTARYEDALRTLGAIRTAGLAGWQFCFRGLAAHRGIEKAWLYKPMRLTIALDRLSPPLPRPPTPTECDPRMLTPRAAL